MTRLPDDQRRITEAWREATMIERDLGAELSHLLNGAPETSSALRLLAECDDLDSLYQLMDLCIRVEESYASQGWRIAWTRAAEEAITRTLAAKHGVTGDTAADAYWTAAAGFAMRVADNPETAESSIPGQGVNIGWLLGTGPSAAAKDTLTVIAMEAVLVLAEHES